MNALFWKNRRVFVTGHTGFKGGWLCALLAHFGAEIHGYSLAPGLTGIFYHACSVGKLLASETLGDVRDPGLLGSAIATVQPQIVLHLAAQPLVRQSYDDPVDTYATNIMGTVHLLEACRKCDSVQAIVNVTSDKCYENREWLYAYRESDPMGGYDPYSSSKACSELIAAAYSRSFLQAQGKALATARAGNVIGGGDGAKDRLIPDFLRALDAKQPLVIRSPHAVRPWQHVLEPVSGYLLLAEKLVTGGLSFAGGWNFGPVDADAKPVQYLVEELCRQVAGARWEADQQPQPHEASSLKLEISKAASLLHWRPRWPLGLALQKVLQWHQEWKTGKSCQEITDWQITDFLASNI